MLDLRVFASFVAVVQEGSISRGAQRTGITQPAMSRQISGLERDLGVELLIRGPGPLRTTPAGARFYERVTDLLSHAENVIGRTKQEGGEGARTLHVVAPSATIDSGIVPFLVSRGTTAPLLDCEPADPFLVFDIATARNADIAISTRNPPPGWERMRLSDGLVRAHMPRRHPLAGRASLTLEELSPEPLILLTPNNAARRVVDHAASQSGIEWQQAPLIVRHPSVAAGLAAGGQGIALLTDDSARGCVAVPVVGPDGPLLVPVIAAWSATHPRREYIETVLAELVRFLDVRHRRIVRASRE
ncbi:LysR family transcriptional regulator [Herbiconiux moechotypicola]|uniref:LysR family transcriptional regulator n=1 Tax=Herbiconiux moechotypicola TaxID=637393 RepID=A0ABP5QY47_9MICO|nr:LysR family transcriptional regulator [Herbiconiux moechotypicola]MCS5731326.1 LysR family transcriptional regulator [Herbiconiux moechotypicola]